MDPTSDDLLKDISYLSSKIRCSRVKGLGNIDSIMKLIIENKPVIDITPLHNFSLICNDLTYILNKTTQVSNILNINDLTLIRDSLIKIDNMLISIESFHKNYNPIISHEIFKIISINESLTKVINIIKRFLYTTNSSDLNYIIPHPSFDNIISDTYNIIGNLSNNNDVREGETLRTNSHDDSENNSELNKLRKIGKSNSYSREGLFEERCFISKNNSCPQSKTNCHKYIIERNDTCKHTKLIKNINSIQESSKRLENSIPIISKIIRDNGNNIK